MDIDFVCDLITMTVMAQGIATVLERAGSASCKQDWQAYNEVCTAMGWLRERLEEATITAIGEV